MREARRLRRARECLGVPPGKAHGRELWLASVGGLLGIALTVALTHCLPGAAVIVFAAPHSQFAQLRAAMGGTSDHRRVPVR